MTADACYFTRARLRRDVPASALRELLAPRGESARAAAGHRVVWSLFGDTTDRTRDFLWRQSARGTFYILSARVPEDRHGLFDVDEPKLFAPTLRPGDRLRFALRANATVARKVGVAGRGKPCDVVMDALHGVRPVDRAAARRTLVEATGRAWLRKQGVMRGFHIPVAATSVTDAAAPEGEDEMVQVMGYHTLRVARRGAPARFGVLDFEGVLEVTDPETFLVAVRRGLGRAKAFGCGLLLLRRA